MMLPVGAPWRNIDTVQLGRPQSNAESERDRIGGLLVNEGCQTVYKVSQNRVSGIPALSFSSDRKPWNAVLSPERLRFGMPTAWRYLDPRRFDWRGSSLLD